MAPDPRYVEALSRSEIFHGVPRAELISLIAHAKLLKIPAGKPALEENSLVHGLHVILDGSFSVMKDGAAVAKLPKGSFFGEISLFSMNIVASATVAATEGTGTLLMLDRNALDEWLGEHPTAETKFFRNLCTELCHRLLNTTEQLASVRATLGARAAADPGAPAGSAAAAKTVSAAGPSSSADSESTDALDALLNADPEKKGR